MEAALFATVEHGAENLLKDLLDHHMSDIDINATDSHGDTALIKASRNGHEGCVMQLLFKAASVNEQNNGGYTALMSASIIGNIEIIKYLIASNADINMLNHREESALFLAIENNHFESARLLQYCGALVNVTNKYNYTMMHYAAMHGMVDIAKFLLEKHAPIDVVNETNQTPLILAIQNGYVKIVELLMEHPLKIDFSYCDEDGDSLLHIAIINSENDSTLNIIRAVLANYDNIDIVNDHKETPLMLACELGLIDIIPDLLEKTPDVCLKDNCQRTCLSRGMAYIEDLQMIVDYDSTILHVRNNHGETIFMVTCQQNSKAAKFIDELYSPNLYDTNLEGNNVMHLAVLAGKYEIVKYLLNKGMSPRALNFEGLNAMNLGLHTSWRNVNYQIVREIRRWCLKQRLVELETAAEDICGICHENTKEYQTECGHVYHVICMLMYIDHTAIDALCPICRQTILT